MLLGWDCFCFMKGNHMYAEIAKDLVHGRDWRRQSLWAKQVSGPSKKIHFRPVEGRFMIKFGRYTSVQERNVEGQVEYPFCTFALTPIANLPRPTDLPDRFTGHLLHAIHVSCDFYELTLVFLLMLFYVYHSYFCLSHCRCGWHHYRCFQGCSLP